MDIQTNNDVGQYVKDLHALADFIEANPAVLGQFPMGVRLFCSASHLSASEFAQLAVSMGDIEKGADQHFYEVTKRFGDHKVQLFTQRETICTKREVGVITEEVEDYDPEVLATVPKVTVVKETPQYEWDCAPSLHELAQQGDQ